MEEIQFQFPDEFCHYIKCWKYIHSLNDNVKLWLPYPINNQGECFQLFKNRNVFWFTNLKSKIKIIDIKEVKTNYPLIRIRIRENELFSQLISSISSQYIFYYSAHETKLIQYFGNIYIFCPQQNFYNNHHPYFTKWLALSIDNRLDYLKIIENAEELHIFEEELYLLLVELNLSHIKNKYFYAREKKHTHPEWKFIKIF